MRSAMRRTRRDDRLDLDEIDRDGDRGCDVVIFTESHAEQRARHLALAIPCLLSRAPVIGLDWRLIFPGRRVAASAQV
jgi:hypothetical protein